MFALGWSHLLDSTSCLLGWCKTLPIVPQWGTVLGECERVKAWCLSRLPRTNRITSYDWILLQDVAKSSAACRADA